MAQETKSNSVEEVDYLENDQAIRGQNFVCLSFLSPESCVQDKQLYTFYKMSESKDDFNTFKEKYEVFRLNESDNINKEFNELNEFSTSVRGLKVRGVYDSIGEAKHRAKKLQKSDPTFNVFVGQVGFWLPWDPSPGEVQDQEYMNDQLNTLMKSYKENQESKDLLWEKNKREQVAKARSEGQEGKESSKETTADEKLADIEKADPWMARKLKTDKDEA